MNMEHGMNKWHSRLICAALILAVLCGMALPGRAWATASGDATENSVTVSEESGRGYASGGDVSDNDVNGDESNSENSSTGSEECGNSAIEQTVAEQYLAEINELLAEAKAIDGTASDAMNKCADIYDRLMVVYTAAFEAYEEDKITEEEHDEIYSVVGEVIAVLYGYGYDPYATATLAYTTSASNYWNYTSSVKKFYWRIDKELSSSIEDGVAEDEEQYLYEHVKVTYSIGSSTTETDVPYSTYNNSKSATLMNCSTLVVTSTNKTSFSLHMETDVGYVITSYRIGCEFSDGKDGGQSGEDCETLGSNAGLTIHLDTSGQYKSTIDVTYEDASPFGHTSNERHTVNYVLLLTVARVNVDIMAEKEADRESVPAGGVVNYTVTANTTNDLTNTQFEDEFLKKAIVTEVTYGTNALTAVTNKNDFTYNTTPTKYYVDTSEGILYIDGKWTEGNTITIKYAYTTDASTEYGSTITNTVIVTGTKTDTTDTIQDVGIAQVDVIVNDPNKGSLRIYKTFNGLTSAQITDLLDNFAVSVKNSAGESVTLSERKTDSAATYYWDAKDLDIGTYVVTETGYTLDGYKCEATYTLQVDAETVSTAAAYSGAISATVQKGSTTFIRLTNMYTPITSVTIKKNVTGGWGDRDQEFRFTATLEDAGGEAIAFADGNMTASFTLKHDEETTFSNIPVGSKITVTETAVAGYTTTYDVYEGTTQKVDGESGNTVIYTIDADGTKIIFYNDNSPAPDTGVLLDSIPYILILVLVIAGVAFFLIRMRTRRDDE